MNKTIALMTSAAAALLLGSCGQNGSKEQQGGTTPPQERLPLVEVMSTAKENVPQEGVYTSTVQANIVNNIAPQTTGRIVSINAEIGDFVSKGQILAEMDRSQLDQAGLRLKNAEDELNRVRQLFEEGGISQSDFESLELSYKVAKSSYDNLLENTVLQSPVSGVVTARNYDRGDMYSMAQPLFTVQQITPVKVLVGISETEYTKVRKGDRVTMTADALPGASFTGTIVRLYPTMDAATHTFNVEAQVRNENRALRPGMYVRVKVTFGVNENITIPDQAAVKMQGAGTRSVFVLNEDGTVSSRVVTLGRHYDGKYEILEGLEEGEQIVVKGQSSLKNGQKVEVAQ